MAKTSGLGDNIYVGGYDISGDINSVASIASPQAQIDLTGIDKSAHERVGGVRDGRMSLVAYFNPSALREHVAFSGLPTADVVLTYARGTVLGNAAACLVGKQINYDGSRAKDGSYTHKVDAVANAFGLEWGVQLTAGKRTDTAATNGTGVDTLASAAFGAQAYLQVFSFAGTDATIKIQDSADNSSFADVTSFAFTQVTTAPFTQRLALTNTATVRQYVRAVTVTTGGFTSCAFSVVLAKNAIAGQVF